MKLTLGRRVLFAALPLMLAGDSRIHIGPWRFSAMGSGETARRF